MSRGSNGRDDRRQPPPSAASDCSVRHGSVIVIRDDADFGVQTSVPETVDIVNDAGDDAMLVDHVQGHTQTDDDTSEWQEDVVAQQRDHREQSADIEFSDAELDYLASK